MNKSKTSTSNSNKLGATSSSKKISQVTSKVNTNNNRSKSPQKEVNKYSASDLDNYLNRIVDKHYEEAKNRVGRDLSETSNCVHLNKFNNIQNSQLINSQVLNQTTGSKGSFREETEMDRTASPEKLKDRYGSKSPSRGGNNPDMTSILMDTETRRYVNEYKNQMEYLRNIVYALDLKLQDQETYKREVSNLRAEADKGNNAREELRKTLLETTKDLKEESDKFNRLVLDLESHNKDILRDLKDANNRCDDLETKLHAQEIKNAQLDAENIEARTKAKAGEIYKAQLQKLAADYSNAEKKHSDTLVQLGSRIQELDDALHKVSTERKALREENGRLQNSNAELKVQLTQEKTNSNHLKEELENLHNKLRLTQGSMDVLKGIQDQRDSFLRDLNKLKLLNDGLIHQIEQMERDVSTRARDGELGERQARDELLRSHRKIAEHEALINELKNTNGKSRKDNIELKNHIITLEQLLCVKEDVYSQLQSSEARLEARQNDCDKLRAQSDANAKAVEAINDKVFELEKLVIYLKNGITDKDDVSLFLSSTSSTSRSSSSSSRTSPRCTSQSPMTSSTAK